MVHPGLTEREEREVTEDNKKEGKGRKPRRKNCLCCQNFTNLGLSHRAEGPCAEVGAQTNDLCWVQCQQLPSHTDLVLICSKAEKTKKMNPKGSFPQSKIDTNQVSSTVFPAPLESCYFNFATRLEKNTESVNGIRWAHLTPFLITLKCRSCQETFGHAFHI